MEDGSAGDGIAVRSQQIFSKNQVNGGRSDLLLIPGLTAESAILASAKCFSKDAAWVDK
jgi:hypothetical protein